MADQIPLDVVSKLQGDEKVERSLEAIARRLEKLDKEQKDAGDSAEKLNQKQKGLGDTISGVRSRYVAFAGVLGALGIAQLARAVVDTAASYELLEVQLEAVIDKGEDSGVIFGQLKDFAASTPFQVANLTDSYVQLRARGFEPTLEVMAALGDLAGTFGKDISTAMQAVTQAAFGEAEMLKQFGIIMKQEGEQVRVIFKGTEQVIAKDSQAIFDHLIRLSEVEFSGGAERLSQTLKGKVSTLKDNLAALADVVFRESGALDALSALTSSLTGLISLDWKALLEGFEDLAIGVNLSNNQDAVDQIAALSAEVQGTAEILRNARDFDLPDIVSRDAVDNSAELSQNLANARSHVIVTGADLARIETSIAAINVEEVDRLALLVDQAEQHQISRREAAAINAAIADGNFQLAELLVSQIANREAVEAQKLALEGSKDQLAEAVALAKERQEAEEFSLAAIEDAAAARQNDPLFSGEPPLPPFEVELLPIDEFLTKLELEWLAMNSRVATGSLEIWELEFIRKLDEEFRNLEGGAFSESLKSDFAGFGKQLGDSAVQSIITNGNLESFFDNLGSIVAARIAGSLSDAVSASAGGGFAGGAAGGIFGIFLAATLNEFLGSEPGLPNGTQVRGDDLGRAAEVFLGAALSFDDAVRAFDDAVSSVEAGLSAVNELVGGGIRFDSTVSGGGGTDEQEENDFFSLAPEPIPVPGPPGTTIPDIPGGLFDNVFEGLEFVINDLGDQWSVGILNMFGGAGATLEAAVEAALDDFAQSLPQLIETGRVVLEGIPDALVQVLINSGAQSFDQLMDALQNAAGVFLASLHPIEADIFTFMSDLGSRIQQAVNDGLPEDVALDALTNELRSFLSGVSGVDLFPVFADVDSILVMLTDRLEAMGLSLEDLPGIAEAAALAVELFNAQIEIDIFDRLADVIGQIPGQEEKAAKIRAELAQLQFKLDIETIQLQTDQLFLAGAITKAERRRVDELLDLARDFGDSLDNFIPAPPREDEKEEEAEPSVVDVRVVEDLTTADFVELRDAMQKSLERDTELLSSLAGKGPEAAGVVNLLQDLKDREREIKDIGGFGRNAIAREFEELVQLELDAALAGLEETIQSMSRVGAAGASIREQLDAFDDMREALELLHTEIDNAGDASVDTSQAMADLAEQEAQLRKELETSVLSQLFSFFEGTGLHEEEILALKQAQKIIELEVLRAQLEALGIFEEYRDVWEEAVDIVNDGLSDTVTNIDDLRNAIEALRQSQADVLTGQNSPFGADQQFFIALGQFNDLLSQVQGGDLSAVQDLISARGNLLGLAGGLGSGVFAQIFAQSFGQIEDLIDSLDEEAIAAEEPLTNGAFAEGAAETQRAIMDSGEILNDTLSRGQGVQEGQNEVIIGKLGDSDEKLGTIAEHLDTTIDRLDELIRLSKAS